MYPGSDRFRNQYYWFLIRVVAEGPKSVGVYQGITYYPQTGFSQ